MATAAAAAAVVAAEAAAVVLVFHLAASVTRVGNFFGCVSTPPPLFPNSLDILIAVELCKASLPSLRLNPVMSRTRTAACRGPCPTATAPNE